ncbi:MAG: FtsX-like permease family protein [Desulfobacteraceae bacterium]
MALFILLISCINYVCLTTTRYSTRAREIGIRKVSGARRSMLIVQFLCESLFFSIIALVISLGLFELFLPFFNGFLGKELSVNYLNNFPFLLSITVLWLFTGVASGIYPAFILSSLNPAQVLKGGVIKTGIKGVLFSKGIILTQWIIACILIIGVRVTLSQLKYMKDKDLGYSHEQVLYLTMDEGLKKKYQIIKNELREDPALKNITYSWYLPNLVHTSTSNTDWEGRREDRDPFVTRLNIVDYNYIETFDMKMASGRSFSKDFSSDLFGSFILNEKAVNNMGLENPVGKWFSVWGMKGPIIGILKDYHLDRLDTPIEPLVLSMSPENRKNILIIKIQPDNMQKTINRLVGKLNEINPDHFYEFRFLNDTFNDQYKSEEIISRLLQCFTGLGIFVASLGLIALVGFMIKKRTKEIGIRKTLGASSARITLLMSASYIKMVAMANIVAWPVA